MIKLFTRFLYMMMICLVGLLGTFDSIAQTAGIISESIDNAGISIVPQITLDKGFYVPNAIVFEKSVSVESFDFQVEAAVDDVTFDPDNGDPATPTVVSIGQVFTITFNGALYSYVNSVPDNNIAVDEEYLESCFTFINDDTSSPVSFSVSILSWTTTQTVVTITPDVELVDESHFTLSILDDKLQYGVRNLNPLGNGDFNVDIYAEVEYLTEDITPPILDENADAGRWEDGYYPGSGEIIANTESLKLDFVEDVKAGTGSISIYQSDGELVKTVDASTLMASASVITITSLSDLPTEQEYYVIVPEGAIVDLAGNPFAGVSMDDNWRFMLHEDYIPKELSFTPTGSNISVETDLVINFDRPVELGSSGNVTVFLSDGTLVQSLSVIADMIAFSINDATVTISIDDLLPITGYMVEVEAGAFIATGGDAFEGIPSSEWQFETEINADPQLISLTPSDDATDVLVDQNLIMEFDMNVKAGAGTLNVYAADGTLLSSVNANDPAVDFNGTTVAVDMAGLLEINGSYYVLVDAGFVTNTSFTPEVFGGLVQPTDWNFSAERDDNDPLVLALSPDNEVIADNHPILEITFDENVELTGTAGSIHIIPVGQVASQLDIDITPGMIQDNMVTITYVYDPNIGGLDANTEYYITVDADALQDSHGNIFPGISSQTEWTFTTGPDWAMDVEDVFGNILNFNVYPNPFTDQINVTNADKLSRIIITNVVGQRVKDIKNPTNTIGTSDLRNGIYFITLLQDNDQIVDTQRLIKK